MAFPGPAYSVNGKSSQTVVVESNYDRYTTNIENVGPIYVAVHNHNNYEYAELNLDEARELVKALMEQIVYWDDLKTQFKAGK